MNTLLNVLLVIIIAGVFMWIVNHLIPMARSFKALLHLVVFILVFIYIMQSFDLIKPVLPYMPVFK